MATTEVTNAEKCRVIAERVMGWTIYEFGDHDGNQPRPHCTKHPLHDGVLCVFRDSGDVDYKWDPFTSPAAMVEVMEKIGSKAHNCRCVVLRITEEDGQWDCTIGLPDDHEGDSVDTRGPTPMHAVAEAAYAWAVK